MSSISYWFQMLHMIGLGREKKLYDQYDVLVFTYKNLCTVQ